MAHFLARGRTHKSKEEKREKNSHCAQCSLARSRPPGRVTKKRKECICSYMAKERSLENPVNVRGNFRK